MAVSSPIPRVTLPAGVFAFPQPAGTAMAVPAGLSDITLTVDRTVAGGLNAAPASTELVLFLEESTDNGQTWQTRVDNTRIIGGLPSGARTGSTIVNIPLSGQAAQVRGKLTVSAPVTVQGSLSGDVVAP